MVQALEAKAENISLELECTNRDLKREAELREQQPTALARQQEAYVKQQEELARSQQALSSMVAQMGEFANAAYDQIRRCPSLGGTGEKFVIGFNQKCLALCIPSKDQSAISLFKRPCFVLPNLYN